MTHQTSTPFSPADQTPPAVDPVQQYAIDARAAYKQSVADARAKWEQSSVDAWERHEQQRHQQFISTWKEDNPWSDEKPQYKYTDWDEESVFRDTCEPSTRLEKLLNAKLYRQYVKCKLVRAGGTASVKQIQEWLAPYLPTTGEYVIKPNDTELANLVRHGRLATTTFAENLSADVYQILTKTYMLTVGLGGRVEFDWHTEHSDRSSW
jgi:hypothetical protein